MWDIAIVGAGVAGTRAAGVLARAGRRVIVLDKAARPGGRCATRRLDAAPDSPWFDHGAQYVTARTAAFRHAVATDLDAGVLRGWRPRIAVAERTDGHWRRRLSPDDRERLIAPRGLNHWVRGHLAASGVTVRCPARVTALAPVADHWAITCDDAPPLAARAVLLTAPAPQCAALLGADEAAQIDALAGADAAMHACLSVVVRAPPLADCDGLFVRDGLLSWIADNRAKMDAMADARGLWTLHAGPAYSDAHMERSMATTALALIAEFAAIAGFDRHAIEIVHSHRWRYARPTEGAPAPETGCWVDPVRGLALAGDWLAGGRVEGAWRSGGAAAHALLGAQPGPATGR